MKKLISLLLSAILLCSLIPASLAETTVPYEIENPGFETGDFTGWTLPEGWPVDENGNPKGLSSENSYWVEKMPINQEGNYHLESWSLQPEITEPEAWHITSSHFILGGAGVITVRMGGASAAVKVYKADGTQIGYFTNGHFKDSNFPNVEMGSWGGMHTFIINLSEYIGEELYLELWDEEILGSWAVAFFDDIKTLYDEVPNYKENFDVMYNPAKNMDVQIKWQRTINKYMPEV